MGDANATRPEDVEYEDSISTYLVKYMDYQSTFSTL